MSTEEGWVPSRPERGWHGCGLHLNAADFALVRAFHERASRVEPAITTMVSEVVAQHPSAELVMLDSRLKTLDSLARKVADRRDLVEVPAQLRKVSDGVRFTVVAPNVDFSERAQQVMEGLAARVVPVQLQSTFGQPGYQGVNTRWRDDAPLAFEVQFHTPASYRAGRLTHAMYEEIRLSTTASERRNLLEAWRLRIYAAVPTPPGLGRLVLPREGVQPGPDAASQRPTRHTSARRQRPPRPEPGLER